MDISLQWLNSMLEPAGLTAEEADEALTAAGFPIEGAEPAGDGDIRLDVEVTSNRGDVLSHVGSAREVAAVTGRRLKEPEWSEPERSGDASEHLTLTNHEPGVCPLFTAQVIRGVKIGPSPDWLARRLEAIGQRPINNVVDVTNFITFELGHPCHVFDLNKLAGASLDIRYAAEGEKLTTLDGKEHSLKPTDLVVADSERAQSLAGIMGGKHSEVDDTTTDVVFEMATWDPVTVRTAARRLAIRTDASYRFERGVAASEIARAAFRAVALLHEVAGGTVCGGMLEDGDVPAEPGVVTLRPERTRKILGVDVADDRQRDLLSRIGIGVSDEGGALRCEIPAFRLDLTREIDLIEEVARLNGLDQIPQADRVGVVVRHPSERERGLREIGSLLVGMGFYEAVTFSFCSPVRAGPWLTAGVRTLAVDDERRGSEPTLRPTPMTGLLACRKANQASQVSVPGGVRLFEIASGFGELDQPGREHVERRVLSLLMDAPELRKQADSMQAALREVRGVCEAVVTHLAGPGLTLRVEACDAPSPAWMRGACATLSAGGTRLARIGLLDPEFTKAEGIDRPLVAAEFDLEALLDTHAPTRGVEALPQFPPIDRDLTLDLPEACGWAQFESLVLAQSIERLESISLVGVYRGEQAGAGKKSVTARLVFRDPGRTLRREEVDPDVERIVAAATSDLGAVVRS